MKIRKLIHVNCEDINDINEGILESEHECGVPTGVIEVTVEGIYEEEEG